MKHLIKMDEEEQMNTEYFSQNTKKKNGWIAEQWGQACEGEKTNNSHSKTTLPLLH